MHPTGRWFQALRASRLAAPLQFFAATWILLGVLPVHATLHLDTARDLLLARDCVLGGSCGIGPPSSFAGWRQGALWSHVLELREALGLGFGALEQVARLALACAAALVAIAARVPGRTPNALTWAAWFAATLPTIAYPTLWNPTLLPLASSLFCAALLHAARTRGAAAFVAAAAALAICVDLHIVSAVLVPFLLAVTVACATRPLVVVPLAGAAFVLVSASSSPAALTANWPLLVDQAPVVAVVLAAATAAGARVRRRLCARDGRARADAVLAGLCIYMLGLPPLLALMTGHPLYARYLAALVTPAAIVLSTRASGDRWTPRAWIRITAVGLVVAGYVAFVVGERTLNPLFRWIEVERVAAALYANGTTYDELHRHLRGPDAIFLLATLAALEPPEPRDHIRDERDRLVVRSARRDLPDPIPASWTVVDLEDDHVAVLAPYMPWMQLDVFEVCRGATNPTCELVDLTAPRTAREGARWADRAYPSLLDEHRPRRGDLVSYRMSVRAPSAGPARRLHLLPDRCKGWRFTGEGSDGHSVRLPADGAVHDVVFTVEAGRGCRWWLPPFVEIEDGDTAVGELLFAGAMR